MRIYLAGPMRGYPNFNFPAFYAAASKLRKEGHFVFSPAERDNGQYGADFAEDNPSGDQRLAEKEHGFNLRKALAADLAFVCQEANAIALLPGWEESRGAMAEYAAAITLGLRVIILEEIR